MASNRQSVRIRVGADTSRFKMAMRGVRNSVKRLGNAVKAAMLPVTALMTALNVLTGSVMVIGIRRTLAFGAELAHLAKRAHMSAGELMVLRQAFEDAGVGGEAVGMTLDRLTRRVFLAQKGTGEYAEAMEMLGLSAKSVSKLQNFERFELVMDKMSKLPDLSKRTAAGMALLDTSAGQMAPLWENLPEALAEARESLGDMPAMMDRNADAFERIDTILNRMKTKIHGLFIPIIERFLPEINALMDRLNTFDFSKVGGAIADFVAKIGDAFRNRIIVEVLTAAFMAAVTTALSYAAVLLTTAIKGSLKLVTNLFDNMPKYADGFVSTLKAGWFSMMAILAGTMGTIIGALEDVLVSIVSWAASILPVGKGNLARQKAEERGYLKDEKLTTEGYKFLSKMATERAGRNIKFTEEEHTGGLGRMRKQNRLFNEVFGFATGGGGVGGQKALINALMANPQEGFAALIGQQERGWVEGLKTQFDTLSGEAGTAAAEAWAEGAESRADLVRDSARIITETYAEELAKRGDTFWGRLAAGWQALLAYEWAGLDAGASSAAGAAGKKKPLTTAGGGAAGDMDAATGAVASSMWKIGGGGRISFARLSTTDTILTQQLAVQEDIKAALTDDWLQQPFVVPLR